MQKLIKRKKEKSGKKNIYKQMGLKVYEKHLQTMGFKV
jgi:hypothetical protein